MAGEDSVRSPEPDGARSAEPARGGSVTLGLIPAPDIPEKIAKELASELPELLGSHVDEGVSWEVSVVVDPLTGTEQEAPELLDACHERLQREGWDLAVCLTDLPVYRSGRLVVADVSAARRSRGSRCPLWSQRGCGHGRERRPSNSSISCTRGSRSSDPTTFR